MGQCGARDRPRRRSIGPLSGYLSTCFRDTPFVTALFLSYEQFKTWKIRLTVADSGPLQVLKPWSDAETILLAGISGGLAAFITTPFDVIKTRIMTADRAMTIGEATR